MVAEQIARVRGVESDRQGVDRADAVLDFEIEEVDRKRPAGQCIRCDNGAYRRGLGSFLSQIGVAPHDEVDERRKGLELADLVTGQTLQHTSLEVARSRRPRNAELAKLLDTLSRCIVRVLERRGLLIADPVDPYLNFEVGSSLDQIQAASINYRIAIGPQAGRKALTLYSVPPLEAVPTIPMLAQMYGFSLHAGTVCEAHQRSKLERLCRYITRPPIATKRLTVYDRGRVVYRYKQPFRDGSTHVVLENGERTMILRRLGDAIARQSAKGVLARFQNPPHPKGQ